jgi:putative transposase
VQQRDLVDPILVVRIKARLEQFATYGYRRLAAILGVNRKPGQRILRYKRSAASLAAPGVRLRARSLPSVAGRMNAGPQI